MLQGDFSSFRMGCNSNRLKIVYLSQQNALGMFSDHTVRAVIVSPQVPRDARVVAVGYEYDRQAFGMIIEHHSFEEVAPGEQIPTLTGLVGFEYEVWKKPETPVEDTLSFDATCSTNWPTDLGELHRLRNQINERIYDLENK